jgi:hypothetical protein
MSDVSNPEPPLAASLSCPALQELLDKEAIRECLYRYCRGIDRIDESLLKSAFWPDAHDDHGGSFAGNAMDYCDYVLPRLKSMAATHHMIGNVMIRLQTDAATVESYFWASHRYPDAQGQEADLLLAGRYLDRMERRSGAWRIASRHAVFDWFRQSPVVGSREEGFFGAARRLGGRTPNDLSDGLFYWGSGK